MTDQTAVTTEARWLAYRKEFPIFDRATYFNSCSLGALSTRVAAAVRSFTDLWDARGADNTIQDCDRVVHAIAELEQQGNA